MGMQGVVQTGRTYTVIGRLRHKIQIVRPVPTQDSSGGWDITQNQVLLETWGSVEALTATEKFAAHEFTSLVTHKVWMRHPRNAMQRVTADMQVWFNKRQFQIEGVLNPDERKDLLLLMCIEIDDSRKQQTAAAPESTL